MTGDKTGRPVADPEFYEAVLRLEPGEWIKWTKDIEPDEWGPERYKSYKAKITSRLYYKPKVGDRKFRVFYDVARNLIIKRAR